jgi:hypothetical protein
MAILSVLQIGGVCGASSGQVCAYYSDIPKRRCGVVVHVLLYPASLSQSLGVMMMHEVPTCHVHGVSTDSWNLIEERPAIGGRAGFRYM